MIDPATGELNLGPLTFRPGMSMGALETTEAWASARLVVVNQKWKTFQIGPVAAGIHQLSFTLLFESEQLRQISFCSEENDEEAAHRINARMLKRDLGRADGRYPWGETQASLDPRTGEAVAVITYADSSIEERAS